MSKRGTTPKKSVTRFDPAVFLKTAAKGRTSPRIRRSKSSLRRAMLRIQSTIFNWERSKSLSYPTKARKPLSQCWGRTSSLVRGV